MNKVFKFSNEDTYVSYVYFVAACDEFVAKTYFDAVIESQQFDRSRWIGDIYITVPTNDGGHFEITEMTGWYFDGKMSIIYDSNN